MFSKSKKTKAPEGEKLMEIKRRRKRRTITSLIILSLCLVITFNVENFVTVARGVFNIGGVQFQEVNHMKYVMPIKEANSAVQKVGERVLKAEGGKLQAYDLEGKLMWEKAYGGSSALFTAVGSRIFLVEKNSGDLFVLNQNGEIVTKREALGKVDRIIAKKEDTIIVYKSLEKKIQILDGEGKDKATIALPYPKILDLDYSPDLDMIGVSVFFVEKDYFHTSVFLFGMDGKMKGARSFNNQMLFRMLGYKDRFIGVSDQGVIAFNNKDDDLWHVKLDQTINRVDFKPNGNFGFNLTIEDKVLDDTRPENALAVLSPEGKWLFNEKIGVVVEKLYLGDHRIAIIGDNQVNIVDFNGRVLGHKAIDKGFKSITWIDDYHIGFEYEDHFVWYKLSY